MIWFALTVFGKIVFVVGPVTPDACRWMIDRYEPPILNDMIIVDGRILTPEDYRPWCIVSPTMPPLDEFDRGQPT